MRHLHFLRRTTALLALTTVSAMALPQLAASETVLRIGMTAADIPRTLGQPDQGFEGNRFTGLTMYDALTMWDLSSATKASVVIPGLATDWKVDEADKTKWVFKLRPGVTFHDGTPFNADAVVWNVDKVLNKEAPQFDASQVGVTASRMPTLVSARKIDDMTVELTTKEPDSFLPINLTNLFMASPSKWQVLSERAEGADAKAKSQAAWAAFAKDAAGTGPWKMAKFTPRERLELVKNDNYWDKARVPKTDRMVLLPMPEANARTAALLAGQVDWVEAPAPDAVKEIESRGFKIEKNEQPHVWPWQFSRIEGSPWNDIRVRRAANLCIDREGLRDGLLAGLMVPATGTFEPGHPWRGKPAFQIKYDLPAAQKLMKEAGFGPAKKLSVKIQTSASGSGQMLPLPMNEYLQQALAECYFDVKLDVIEWNTLFTNWRRGVKDPSANGSDAVNITYAAMDPFFALVRFLQSSMAPPVSNNWGYINNPKFDELVKKARTSFNEKERDEALAELNAASIDDAAFLYVAHDVGPRALSPKIKGFVQPKSWFVDFSPVSISQ
ncbi:ABC transporter substrate-binding protein [Rhodopseudomonas sp. HC1]|uniref:ABC transporter substrate-binding protein n=1 Tax=Rhodopseudomonas infernalis TaxID=2897386 RepID=UPI001EE8F5C9|nr:ABC transporter substrate-binding protein [Rhodopseudomonas infernalis]MCG6206942.1 ABC transporter substrate-binding protein [Rhodopseudomonas infernalis]